MTGDLKRLEQFYNDQFLQENYWQDFNLYPYYLGQTQYKMLIRILKDLGIRSNTTLYQKTILDIGAGEGNLILSLLRLGADIKKISAVELLTARFAKLQERFCNAQLYCGNYLDYKPATTFDIITIMAVLSSIIDEDIRTAMVNKAYRELANEGLLIIYDYDKPGPVQLTPNYKSVSFQKIIEQLGLNKHEYRVYSKVYINAKIGKGLCLIGGGFLIPFFQSFKIFNDEYAFLVIRRTKPSGEKL